MGCPVPLGCFMHTNLECKDQEVGDQKIGKVLTLCLEGKIESPSAVDALDNGVSASSRMTGAPETDYTPGD